MRRGRPTPQLILTPQERHTLERWARRPAAGPARALRARLILGCADGIPNSEVARALHLARRTVGKWRARFLARRLAGLRVSPQPGAARVIPDAALVRVLAVTLQGPPPGNLYWSTRALARRCRLSQSTVSRIWRAFGLLPARGGAPQRWSPPVSEGALRELVEWYLNPRRSSDTCLGRPAGSTSKNTVPRNFS